MGHAIENIGGHRVLVVYFTGVVSAQALTSVFNAIHDDDAVEAGMPALWDLTKADLSEFALEDMNQLKENSPEFAKRQGARVAILFRNGIEQPIFRLWDTVITGTLDQTRKTFLTREEAEAWLLEG